MARIKTVGSIKDFVNKNKCVDKELAKAGAINLGYLAGTSIPLFLIPTKGFAMTVGEQAKAQIVKAFDPLIDLVQAVAYPVAGVMVAWGCLCFMIGLKEKGIEHIRNASLGYILVQLSPTILKLIVTAGSAIN